MTHPLAAHGEEAQASSFDRDLVRSFQLGQRPAYDLIYRTYRSRVVATCRKYLRDERDVEEAVQDTFTKAYTALDRFNGQFRLGAWLSRIATNVSIDRARVNMRRPSGVPLDTGWDLPDPTPTPYEVSTEPTPVGDVVDLMPRDQRTALRLRSQGLSHEEIGAAVGKSPTQVKALLHRARSSFKKLSTGATLILFAVGAAIAVRTVRLVSGLGGISARLQERIAAVAEVSAPPVAAVLAELQSWTPLG